MINFNIEIEKFKIQDIRKHKAWLKELAKEENFDILELNYIFLNDEALLKMNIEYLNHDTLTDIITFDNSELELTIEGDIFISVERVNENAKLFNISPENELKRVMAHGLLHLCGYKDKTESEITEMRAKENFYLEKFNEK